MERKKKLILNHTTKMEMCFSSFSFGLVALRHQKYKAFWTLHSIKVSKPFKYLLFLITFFSMYIYYVTSKTAIKSHHHLSSHRNSTENNWREIIHFGNGARKSSLIFCVCILIKNNIPQSNWSVRGTLKPHIRVRIRRNTCDMN